MEFSVQERINIAKEYLEVLKEKLGGSRGNKIVGDARVWNGGQNVRIYGLCKSRYVAILEDGTIKNNCSSPFHEMFEAIDEMKKRLPDMKRSLEKKHEEEQKKQEKEEQKKELEKQKEAPRYTVKVEKFIGKKYDSAQGAYDDLRKYLKDIEGSSDKQIKFAQSIRRNVLSGLANHIYDAQRAEELENDLMVENEKHWLKKYHDDYEFALNEFSARRILDRFANTGFRNDAL